MTTQTRNPNRAVINLIGIGVVVGVIALVVVLALSVGRPAPQVPASAFGMDGLHRWLNAEDIPARRFSGGLALDPEGIGVRILPLYDANPNLYGEPGETEDFTSEEDQYLRTEIVRMNSYVMVEKAETLPTILVLSKWRDGVRQSGLLHRDFLIDAGSGDPVVSVNLDYFEVDYEEDEAWDGDAQGGADEADDGEDAGLDEVDPLSSEKPGTQDIAPSDPSVEKTVSFDDEVYMDRKLILPRLLPVTGDLSVSESIPAPTRFGGTVRLAVPQYAEAGEACEALVGSNERGLVFACESGDLSYWVVSDPDLLNTMGLQHAENRAFATAFIDETREGGEVLIDYSTNNWIFSAPRGRDIADLLRYFEPPFLWLWLAAVILFALAFWRGAVREGPLAKIFTEGHGMARKSVFAAQARLMQATGRDGALVRALAKARLVSLAELLLGRDVRGGDRTERLLAVLERRNTDLAARWRGFLANLAELPDRVAPDTARAALADLETVYAEARALAGVKS